MTITASPTRQSASPHLGAHRERARGIGLGGVIGLCLLAGCDAHGPQGQATPATDTIVVTRGPAEVAPSPERLPAGHYRGVSAVRPLPNGTQADTGCPERYREVDGLCVHGRLLEMQTGEHLAGTLAAYRMGIAPPIVADLPPRGPLDPARLDPGALTRHDDRPSEPARGADQEEGEEAQAESPADKSAQTPDKGPSPAPLTDAAGALRTPVPGGVTGARDGDSNSDASPEETPDGTHVRSHVNALQEARRIAEDGEVTPAELEGLLGDLEGEPTQPLLRQMLEGYLGSPPPSDGAR